MPVFDILKSLYKRLPRMFKVGPIPGITKSKWIDDLKSKGVPLTIDHEYIILLWEERYNKIDAELVKLKRKTQYEHNQQDLFKFFYAPLNYIRVIRCKHGKLKIENLEKEKKNIEDLTNLLAEDLLNSVNEAL